MPSDPNDENIVCMGSNCSQIGDVATQDGASWLGTGHNNGVNGRTLSRQRPEYASATSQMLRELFNDVACLEESAREGVGSRTSTEAFDQNDRRNYGRPQGVTFQCCDHRRRVLILAGEAGYTA
jgi:hypothetical protein